MKQKSNIFIVGGGLTGLSLATMLSDAFSDSSITLLQNEPVNNISKQAEKEEQADQRTLVLMDTSKIILQKYNMWQSLSVKSSVINRVNFAIDNNRLSLNSGMQGDAMVNWGHMLPAQYLIHCLQQQVANKSNIEVVQAQVKAIDNINSSLLWQDESGDEHNTTADLILVCSGMSKIAGINADIQSHDFNSQAWIVALSSVAGLDADEALLQFMPSGHLAILPSLHNNRNAVLVCPNHYDEKQVVEYLHSYLLQLGMPAQAIKINSHYPLQQKVANKRVFNNTVLLGNAAHSLHPIGAQGFNLTLRTLDYLITALKSQEKNLALSQFTETSLQDIKKAILTTKSLAKYMGKSGTKLISHVLLASVKHSPTLRHKLIQAMLS